MNISLLKLELILRWFEAVPRGPGESQEKRKEVQEGFQRTRGVPPSSSKALLGLFSLILAFPWAPWNCLKPPFIGDQPEGGAKSPLQADRQLIIITREAREEPEGRPGGPGRGKRARGMDLYQTSLRRALIWKIFLGPYQDVSHSNQH